MSFLQIIKFDNLSETSCEFISIFTKSSQPSETVFFSGYAQFIHRNENHVILVHAPECAEVTQAGEWDPNTSKHVRNY